MTRPPNPAPTLRLVNAIGNLLGAIAAFLYFRVVDPAATSGSRAGLPEVIWSIGIFAALVGIGQRYGSRWMAPIGRASGGEPLSPGEAALVRRRALLFPYFLAGLSFTGWVMAGLIYGVAIPFLMGHLFLPQAARQVFGLIAIAGSVTTAFIFFTSEHVWRRRLPFYFPEGDLRAVPRVPRLSVRTRLLTIFLLVGVMPPAILGILSYTRALGLQGADATTAAEIIANLRVTILFLVGVGIAAAIGLSIFAANSVAAPLRDVEAAMAEVERGRLDGRAPVADVLGLGFLLPCAAVDLLAGRQRVADDVVDVRRAGWARRVGGELVVGVRTSGSGHDPDLPRHAAGPHRRGQPPPGPRRRR